MLDYVKVFSKQPIARAPSTISRAIKKYDVKSLSLVIIARAWCCTSNDNLSFLQSKILCEVNH